MNKKNLPLNKMFLFTFSQMEKYFKELIRIILENLFPPHQLSSHKHKRENNLIRHEKETFCACRASIQICSEVVVFFVCFWEQVDILA